MQIVTSVSRCNFQVYDEDDEEEESYIQWSNLIFLPFNSTFKLLVFLSFTTKSIMGPLTSIIPELYCNMVHKNQLVATIIFFYTYCCDFIYALDTCLYIVHKQVEDTALRRDFLPKPVYLIMFDIISLIPFYRMLSLEECTQVSKLWPNILTFNEMILIYRVFSFFELGTTHSFYKCFIGFTMLVAIGINGVTTLWILITSDGLCETCDKKHYDWRAFVEVNEQLDYYFQAAIYFLSTFVNAAVNILRAGTMAELVILNLIAIFNYFIMTLIISPKLFAENFLNIKKILHFQPRVRRIIEDTHRRLPQGSTVHVDVHTFYYLVWTRRSGITAIPDVIRELPRYLKTEIKEDLVWSVFYHSPTLRQTSAPFKRSLSNYIQFEYKMSGEKLFAGSSKSHLYYLKTGIVQIISSEDGVTPMLSLSSGTLLGDVNFLVPSHHSKVITRCLTYCEVLTIPRAKLLFALHKYPDDRKMVFNNVKNRIKHAQSVYACKTLIKGIDRTEDEGLAWIKKRWWQIADISSSAAKNVSFNDDIVFTIPPEDSHFHCSKYIGQLVLCNEQQLQTEPTFISAKFPWILEPYSMFRFTWHRIVMTTVVLVLFIYPPITALRSTSDNQNDYYWFDIFEHWTNIIFISDIIVSLMTSTTTHEDTTDFTSVIFDRCKSLEFYLDLLTTPLIDYLMIHAGKEDYVPLCKFTRVIKIYIFFIDTYVTKWDIVKDPLIDQYSRNILLKFSFVYVSGFFIYLVCFINKELTLEIFFCNPTVEQDSYKKALKILLQFIREYATSGCLLSILPTRTDIYTMMGYIYIMFIAGTFITLRMITATYIKNKEIINYQYFVSQMKKEYKIYHIHLDLLKRLDTYLIIHWKAYKGVDIMHSELLKDEPHDIYYKVHGQIAENIIGHSRAFRGANPSLIKELSFKSRFLLLPKHSTLYLHGAYLDKVSWIVKGELTCEYFDKKESVISYKFSGGEMLGISSVFFSDVSMRTYIASTDCEILYINVKDFFNILQRYPHEYEHIKISAKQLQPAYEKLYQKYIGRPVTSAQRSMRKRLTLQEKMMVKYKYIERSSIPLDNDGKFAKVIKWFARNCWIIPYSTFFSKWMVFRIITIIISIVTCSIQGGIGAMYRPILWKICLICDFIGMLDIIFKLFLAYYNEQGILIYGVRKTVTNYLSHGFLLDIIGTVPWYKIINITVPGFMNQTTSLLFNSICRFAHVYLINGYFNFIGNWPTINLVYIMIIKWQLILALFAFCSAHFFMTLCISFEWDDDLYVVAAYSEPKCWYRYPTKDFSNITDTYIGGLTAFSLLHAQYNFMRLSIAHKYMMDLSNSYLFGITILQGLIHWYATTYCTALLVLNYRGASVYQDGINQLGKFLKAERVDKNLIDRAVKHFQYLWQRTNGVNIQNSLIDRIGIILRQDLSYFFYKGTFSILDKQLKLSRHVKWILAFKCVQAYFLANSEIMREMDVVGFVYVIHRGTVILSRQGKILREIGQGATFGILNGPTIRPAAVSAKAKDYVDILMIPISKFHESITEETKDIIMNTETSKYDYIPVENPVPESPYHTVQYLLQGSKVIQLPWMETPAYVDNSFWYPKMLMLAWLIAPVAAIAVSLLVTLDIPHKEKINFVWTHLIVWDTIHFIQCWALYWYSLELKVVGSRVLLYYLRAGKWKNKLFIADVLSMLLPLLTIPSGIWYFQLARLLRVSLLMEYYTHFCRNVQSNLKTFLLYFFCLILVIHGICCFFIKVTCEGIERPLFSVGNASEAYLKEYINMNQWTRSRKYGCLLKMYVPRDPVIGHSGKLNRIDVRPKSWHGDYLLAFTSLVQINNLLSYEVNIGYLEPIIVTYARLFIAWCLCLLDMWITSKALSFMYIKFRQQYHYDYKVQRLLRYLKDEGLSYILSKSVKQYTKQLWRRQRGNWLPELAQEAPQCLRQDIMKSLYIHHLEETDMFKEIPHYFLRQLVAQFHRIVIFPGHYIVRAGDVLPWLIFVHEGEVEQHHLNKKGEIVSTKLLKTNAYFGFFPGLKKNTPFNCSYYTRTVVDLVYLKLRDWKVLIDIYPDVREYLFTRAKEFNPEPYNEAFPKN